jgi:hypothetical protein
MGGFAGEISKVLKDRPFEQVALQSLTEIFGENNIQSLVFHIGGEVTFKDPELFEKKIRALFKDGAELILNHIMYNALRTAVPEKETVQNQFLRGKVMKK